MPTTTVELGKFVGFQLDSATNGILDTNILDYAVEYTDVTNQVFGVSVSRGRNRDLNRMNAGQVNVEFRNEDRDFDPSYSSAPYKDYAVPRLPVRVFTNGTPVFTGVSDDWKFDYRLGGNSTARLDGSDAFTLFATEVFPGGTVVSELTSARINNVLDDTTIPWPTLERDINTGQATLVADTLEGNVLQYLQKVEASEGGLIFMSKDGKFAFRERQFQPVDTALEFSDNGGGVPYQEIGLAYGTELLANDVTVTSPGGTVIAGNETSQTVYGVASLSVDTLLEVGGLDDLADFILFRYGLPELRVESVTVNMKGLTLTQQDDVLALELGGQANVVFTPNQVGSEIAIQARVIGINHDISPDTHTVRFAFETIPLTYFVLDDAVFGTLDNTEGVLGF
jgi:hypothetical protein